MAAGLAWPQDWHAPGMPVAQRSGIARRVAQGTQASTGLVVVDVPGPASATVMSDPSRAVVGR
jgi:hypothetical protein